MIEFELYLICFILAAASVKSKNHFEPFHREHCLGVYFATSQIFDWVPWPPLRKL